MSIKSTSSDAVAIAAIAADTELTSIPVRVEGVPGYADFDATLILEITRPSDGVHFSVVEAEWEGKVETIPVPSVCVIKPPPSPTFDLFITTKEGRTSKSLRSPYPSREETRRTITVVVSGPPENITHGEATAFADSVFTAPLGVPVTHEATGITFRTEYTRPLEGP